MKRKFIPPKPRRESYHEYVGNTPRPVDFIVGDYHKLCEIDERIIEQMAESKGKELISLNKRHNQLTAMLRELDEERNYAIPFYHNVFRLHYAQTYPRILSRSITKQQKHTA